MLLVYRIFINLTVNKTLKISKHACKILKTLLFNEKHSFFNK